jgi:polyhydroxyalkanoate synthesis regulator phasin
MKINLNGNVRTFTPFTPASSNSRTEILTPKDKSQSPNKYQKIGDKWVLGGESRKTSAKDVSNEPTHETKTWHSETDANEMNLRINESCIPKDGELYSKTNYLEKAVNSSSNSAKDVSKQANAVKSQSPNKYQKNGGSWVLGGESPKTSAKDVSKEPTHKTKISNLFSKHTEIYATFAGRNARETTSLPPKMLNFANNFSRF